MRSDPPAAALHRYRDNVARSPAGEVMRHVPSGRPCKVVESAWLAGCVVVEWLTTRRRSVVHLASLERPAPVAVSPRDAA